MQVKTRGIVFGSTRYGESSVIARIYTEELGMRSFMVRGVRKRRSRNSAALLQPLSLVEIEARIKESTEVQNLAEIRLEHPFAHIPFSIVRSTQVLFLDELLSKSIREQEGNTELFGFLHHSIRLLDMMEDDHPDFHLLFALKLTRFLGFQPSRRKEEEQGVFDLQEGSYRVSRPLHPHYIEGEEGMAFERLSRMAFEELPSARLHKAMRQKLLRTILDYYRLHTDSFGTFKSAEVLESVFG